MKQSEIQVGKCYTNGKGTVREVTSIDRRDILWGGHANVWFMQVVHGAILGPISLKSFAAWAKSEVPGGSDG